MKNRIIIYSCFVCLFTLVGKMAAQTNDGFLERTQVGLMGGLNFANYGYSSKGLDAYSQSVYPRGSFGLFAEYRMNKGFSVRPEFLYMGRGVKIDDNGTLYKVKSNYLDIRLPFIYSFSRNASFQPYVALAPYVGFNSGGSIELDDYQVNVTDASMSSVDFGAWVGVGGKFPFQLMNIPLVGGVEIGYSLGLSDTFADKEKSSEAHAMNLPTDNYQINGTRKNRGVEVNLSIAVPLSIFKRKPKPAPVAEPIVEVKPVTVRDTIPYKDCYTIEEVISYLNRGFDVHNRKICMYNLQFDFNKSTLKEECTAYLDKIVLMLNTFPAMKMGIYGHTDDVGNKDYNDKLSLSRARSVYLYLVSKKIDKNRLSYKGFGSAMPIASNDTEAGRYENRRVEFDVLNTY